MRPAERGYPWLCPETGRHFPERSCLKAVRDGLLVGNGDALLRGFDQTYRGVEAQP